MRPIAGGRSGVLMQRSGYRMGSIGFQCCVLPAAIAWVTLFQASHAHGGMNMGLQDALGAWALMVVAMMLPLQHALVTGLAARTFPVARYWVVGAFLTAYLGIWMAAGAAFLSLPVPQIVHQAPWLPLLVAALWWLGPVRAQALARCHFRPVLAPRGPRAVTGALRYGAENGIYCVLSCLLPMAAMYLAGGGIVGMALLTALLVAERSAHRPDPTGALPVMLLFGVMLSLR